MLQEVMSKAKKMGHTPGRNHVQRLSMAERQNQQLKQERATAGYGREQEKASGIRAGRRVTNGQTADGLCGLPWNRGRDTPNSHGPPQTLTADEAGPRSTPIST